MAFSRAGGSRFRYRLWRRGMAVLLPAALVLLWAAGARAADRIYWGDAQVNVISFANLDGTGHGGNLKTTGVSPNLPIGLAMDLLRGKIYWADGNGSTISFANLDNSGGGGHLNTDGATTPTFPDGVATDPATGRIYWADGGTLAGPLSFANLNDTGGGDDLSTTGATVSNPTGVAIDPANGKVYWANATANKISFANLDGTGHASDLHTTGAAVNNPEGVAIDPDNGKIYWANEQSVTHPISFANLNNTGHGGNLKVSGATSNGPFGLAIDPEAGKIYWANFDTISFAKLNDTGGGGELKTTGASPLDDAAFPALVKAPLAAARPKISGGSRVGSKLSCSSGKWTPDLLGSFLYQRPVSFSYAWSRNGIRISGATNAITPSSAGTYACTVTAKNQAGGTKQTSAAHTVKKT